MAERLVLHIGPRKTGTTFLQRALTACADDLERSGIQYAPIAGHNHVTAVADVAVAAGDTEPGTWEGRDGSDYEQLVDAVNGYRGTSVVSAEYLATVRRPTAKRFLSGFDCAIDVVITARDLTRVLPSHWQQHIRNGGTQSFCDLLRVRERQRQERQTWETEQRHNFWRSYCYGDLVTRWSALPGVRSLTFVTVPAASSDPSDLWRRFRIATGLELQDQPPALTDRLRNAGLAAAQATLIAAENARALREGKGKRGVIQSHQWLLAAFEADTERGRPAVIPDEFAASVRGWIDEDLEQLKALDSLVVGDLSDLDVREASFGPTLAVEDVADLAVRMLSQRRPRRRRHARQHSAPDE
jgi:hypothetical protein